MRSVAEKMGITAGQNVGIYNGPRESVAEISLPVEHKKISATGKAHDHVIWFVMTQSDMEHEFDDLKTQVLPTGKLWVAWPKGGAHGTDLTIKEVIRIGYDHGMVESINLRIDDVWTALKFTFPKPGKIYSNSYGQLNKS